MKNEIYISCDIEADGPIPGPDQYSMNSIGAAVATIRYVDGTLTQVNPDISLTATLEPTFYAELAPISDNWLPEAFDIGVLENFPKNSTLEEKRDHLIKTGESPESAMTRFAEWLKAIEKHYEGVVVFAAYPLGFDWMWVYWYLTAYSKVGSPFGFSRHFDAKTAYSISHDKLIRDSVKGRMPKNLLSKRKHTHKAIDDAVEQGEMIHNILASGSSK